MANRVAIHWWMLSGICGRPSVGMIRTSWIISVSMATYPAPGQAADCCYRPREARAVPRSAEPDTARPKGRFSGPSNSCPLALARISASLLRASGVKGGTVPCGPTMIDVRRFQASLAWPGPGRTGRNRNERRPRVHPLRLNG